MNLEAINIPTSSAVENLRRYSRGLIAEIIEKDRVIDDMKSSTVETKLMTLVSQNQELTIEVQKLQNKVVSLSKEITTYQRIIDDQDEKNGGVSSNSAVVITQYHRVMSHSIPTSTPELASVNVTTAINTIEYEQNWKHLEISLDKSRVNDDLAADDRDYRRNNSSNNSSHSSSSN